MPPQAIRGHAKHIQIWVVSKAATTISFKFGSTRWATIFSDLTH
jgi:hypothetical protein